MGPEYDIDSATLKKLRRANGPLKTWERGFVVEYANAVEKAVLAKQRSQLKGYGEPNLTPQCASGTWHSDGESIHKAIQSKQRTALAAAPARIRKARKPHEWQALYDEAMQHKRGISA